MALATNRVSTLATTTRPAPALRQYAAIPQSRQRDASCSGSPWAPSHSCRRRRCRQAPQPPAAGFFGGLFGSGSDSGSSPEPEGLQTDEGGVMVPLDASSSGSLDGSSEDAFGPLALLAVGFTAPEFERLRRLLHEELEAQMVRLVPATPAAMAGSLGAALEQDPPPPYAPPPLGTRRVLFLSGMYAAEVMEVIAAFKDSGLPEAVFAAAVPNNYGRPVQELVQEVFADHQAMKAQRQRQWLEQQQRQATGQ